MKPAIIKILAAGLIITGMLSCKKSATVTPTEKTKTVLLTQSAWKVQSLSVDLNKDGTGDADATSYFQSCDLDNTYSFKTDGSGTTDEGATKCNPDNPQTASFTWLFKSGETILSGNFTLLNGDASIISINDTSLVISYDYLSSGIYYRIIATLQH
jgi:hypothetical protein